MTADDRDESFLARWSRLKQAPAKPAKPADAPPAEPVAAKPVPPAEDDEDEKIDLAELPSIESLSADSDFSVFMRKGVPEDLRRQALRKLWVCNPVVAAADPFDVYNLDYFNMPSFPEGVKTLFRVGHGMMDALEDKADSERPIERRDGTADPPGPTEPRIAATQQESGGGGDENPEMTGEIPKDRTETKQG